MKLLALAVTAGLCVVIAAVVVLISYSPGDPVPPARPVAVPSGAIWKGGLDGGSFIECREILAEEILSCAVYNDYTGELWMSARYALSTLREEVSPWSVEAFYSALSGFDGTALYLFGSQRLTALD